MRKLAFAPFGIAAGLLAGLVARKAFARIWGTVDAAEPPAPDQRDVSVLKLAAALVLEGAIFQLARGLSEHGARSWFAAKTGRWPGEEPSAAAPADE